MYGNSTESQSIVYNFGCQFHQPLTGPLMIAKSKSTLPKDGQIENVQLSDIVLDRETQIRVDMCDETIQRYFDVMENEKALGKFPPILLFRDADETLWLADGYHRVKAAMRRGFPTICAVIIAGTKADAILAAVEANARNGLRLKNVDIHRAVEMILHAHPEKSTTAIAELVQCGQSTVDRIRRQLTQAGNLKLPETVIGKDGKSYTIRKVPCASPKPTVKQPQQSAEGDTDQEYEEPEEVTFNDTIIRPSSAEVSVADTNRLAELKQFCEKNYTSPWPHEMARDLVAVLPESEQCHLASVFFDEMIAKWKYEPELPNIMINFIRNNFMRLGKKLRDRSLRDIFDSLYGEDDLVDKIMNLVKKEDKRYDAEFAELNR